MRVSLLPWISTITLAWSAVAEEVLNREPRILEYDLDTSYTKFTVPCWAPTACLDDDALVWELSLGPSSSSSSLLDFTVNGVRPKLPWLQGSPVETCGVIAALDVANRTHTIAYNVSSSVSTVFDQDDLSQSITFESLDIDAQQNGKVGFAAKVRRSSSPQLQSLYVVGGDPANVHRLVDFGVVNRRLISTNMFRSGQEHGLELLDELELLYSLEEQAEALQARIVAKKQAIAQHLHERRGHATLRHLLEECHGLFCAARVIAQRISDQMGVSSAPSPAYAPTYGTTSSQSQHAVTLSVTALDVPQNSRNCTKSKPFAHHRPTPEKLGSGTARGLNLPLMITKNATTHDYYRADGLLAPNPVWEALGALATLLGIAALVRFLRRRCMSMRTKVERAADREERRTARAYRKAARRAAMRKRWHHFVRAISCFPSSEEPRLEDFDEKRALILQDAFLEQMDDLDQAEKGELMEAEIRELRHAHDIVASLVRVGEHRFDLVPLVNDPPPPFVPLPFTPETRSRSSTGTLPSYSSESLPDYSFPPAPLDDGPSRAGPAEPGVGHAIYPSPSSALEGTHPPPSTPASGPTRCTPHSSILETSPRPSGETLPPNASAGTRAFETC